MYKIVIIFFFMVFMIGCSKDDDSSTVGNETRSISESGGYGWGVHKNITDTIVDPAIKSATKSSTIQMTKVLLDSENIVLSDYNEMSESFDNERNILENSKRIYLTNNAWTVVDDSEIDISFDTSGNIVFKHIQGSATLKFVSEDISGKEISSFVISEFKTTKVFTEGAKRYEFELIDFDVSSTYEISFWSNSYYDPIQGKEVEGKTNRNFEYEHQERTYENFEELVQHNKLGNEEQRALNYQYLTQQGKEVYVDIAFVGQSEVLARSWRDGNDVYKNGTYTIETIDGYDVMYFSIEDENTAATKKAIALGSYGLYEIEILDNNIVDKSNIDNYNEMRYYVRIPYLYLNNYISEHMTTNYNPKPIDRIWDIDADGYLTPEGTIEYYYMNNVTNQQEMLEEKGSYEIRQVGSEEILVIERPQKYNNENEFESNLIFSVQDGRVREGSYMIGYVDIDNVAIKINEESNVHNEIAIRDIYTAFCSDAENAVCEK